eukprot:13478561-Alexandrium_andersonii.AAC.1
MCIRDSAVYARAPANHPRGPSGAPAGGVEWRPVAGGEARQFMRLALVWGWAAWAGRGLPA